MVRKMSLKNPVVTLLVLALLMLAIVSPFAVLAGPMLILFGAVVLWFGWTLVQALLQPSSSNPHPPTEES
jgi:hypothetical protein